MNALTSLLKKATYAFSTLTSRKSRHEQFPVARDWALALIVALFVLVGAAGYASLILFSHSSDQPSEEGTRAERATIRRDEIDAVIEAYAKKDASFATRADALVEVSDPSL